MSGDVIYRNFEELVSKNQAVFSLLSKSGQKGLALAIWNAREAEIKKLSTELAERQAQIIDLQSQLTSYEALSQAKIETAVEELKLQKALLEEEMAKSSEYVNGLREFAEKSNLHAKQAEIRAQKAEEESSLLNAMILNETNKALEFESRLTEKSLEFNKLEEQVASFDHKFLEKTQEIEKLRHGLEKNTVLLNQQISLCEKQEAESKHLKLHVSFLENEAKAKRAEADKARLELKEIAAYADKIRADYEACFINYEKSEKNVNRLEAYISNLQKALKETTDENQLLKEKVVKLDEFTLELKQESQKLRLDRARMGKVLDDIQKSLGRPTSSRSLEVEI